MRTCTVLVTAALAACTSNTSNDPEQTDPALGKADGASYPSGAYTNASPRAGDLATLALASDGTFARTCVAPCSVASFTGTYMFTHTSRNHFIHFYDSYGRDLDRYAWSLDRDELDLSRDPDEDDWFVLQAGTPSPSATLPTLHATWTFPPPPPYASGNIGFYNVDSRIAIARDPGPGVMMTWRSSFAFVASGNTEGILVLGDGMARNDGTTGRTASFAIPTATGATAAPGATCVESGGATTCSLDYDWSAGHTYRLRVWAIPPVTWRGAIEDEQSGIESVIGDIQVPASWQWLDALVDDMTTDSGATYTSCGAAPSESATFFAPTANNLTIAPTAATSAVDLGATCTNVVSMIAADRSSALQQLNP